MLFAYKPVLYDDSVVTMESSTYASQSYSITNSSAYCPSLSYSDTGTPHATYFFTSTENNQACVTYTGSSYYSITRRYSHGGYSVITIYDGNSGTSYTGSYSGSSSYSEAQEEYTYVVEGYTLVGGVNSSTSYSSSWSSSEDFENAGGWYNMVTMAACPSSSGSTFSGVDQEGGPISESAWSTWVNTVGFPASTTTSYTTLLVDTVDNTSTVGTRTARVITNSETDAGSQLVSFHTELIASGTNEAVCLHLSPRTGAVCTLLGEPGVYAGDYTLIANRFFETTGQREIIATLYDQSLYGAGATYGFTFPEDTLVWDDYKPSFGASTYDVVTQVVDSKITTSASSRPTPTVEARTTQYGAYVTGGSTPISEALGTTTWRRNSFDTYAELKPAAQEPGFMMIRGTRNFFEVATVGTSLPFVTTVDSSSSTSESVTSVFSTQRYGRTESVYAEAGSTHRLDQFTYIVPGNMPVPPATPVIVKRVGLGGMQIPSALYTHQDRYANPAFSQTPTQYGFAQRPAVLAPLFSNTDVTEATGGSAATKTAFLWDTLTSTASWAGVNDRPATWDAFVITPVGVFLAAGYNDASESGPANLSTTYYPFTGQTTRALTGLRTVWESVDQRSHRTESAELAYPLFNASNILNGLASTTPRFHNNTEEFF